MTAVCLHWHHFLLAARGGGGSAGDDGGRRRFNQLFAVYVLIKSCVASCFCVCVCKWLLLKMQCDKMLLKDSFRNDCCSATWLTNQVQKKIEDVTFSSDFWFHQIGKQNLTANARKPAEHASNWSDRKNQFSASSRLRIFKFDSKSFDFIFNVIACANESFVTKQLHLTGRTKFFFATQNSDVLLSNVEEKQRKISTGKDRRLVAKLTLMLCRKSRMGVKCLPSTCRSFF